MGKGAQIPTVKIQMLFAWQTENIVQLKSFSESFRFILFLICSLFLYVIVLNIQNYNSLSFQHMFVQCLNVRRP